LEVVEELLKHGAHVNDQPSGKDCDRITPIHDAANNGHLDVMRVLIDYGASVLLKDAHVSFYFFLIRTNLRDLVSYIYFLLSIII
jgi:hypothetical protein